MISFLILGINCDLKFKLDKVLILSRHNVRTPLSKNLADYSPRSWPIWKEKSGYLTEKGILLEGFMGSFFSLWLRKNYLLNDACPDDETFYVYANTAQRTMASAKAFVSKAFPQCNITVHHSEDTKDPIFNPIIHNSSLIFKLEAKEQMQFILKSLHLNESYVDLENILNFKQSKCCMDGHHCDLNTDKNKIMVNVGIKPNLEGPLKISKSVVDSFIMENYEGFPMHEVAWGLLKNTEEWNTILDLSKGYHNVIFNTTLVAKDVARPILKFMKQILIEEQYKTTLLMGHDANIYTVLKSLNFKPYILKYQHEVIPAGGKLVFQKWYEETSGEYYLKVDYVYQCTEEMREGKSLSLDNPPEFTSLELEDCEVDQYGFCLWNDFVHLLEKAIDNE